MHQIKKLWSQILSIQRKCHERSQTSSDPNPRRHFLETEQSVRKVGKYQIATWLLSEGYYPEQYILPPCFKVSDVSLQDKPYFQFSDKKPKVKPQEPERISFPKSMLIDRTFGIYEPKIHHDIVYHLMDGWDIVLDHLYNHKNKIYSYSFPIPASKDPELLQGLLRSGRMIYEFIEMAEKDLLKESYRYKYVLKADIKNFYPSIYSHSIAWALHGKEYIRNGRKFDYNLLGNKLDRLLLSGRDGCTNGVEIGPAVSDLIAEIILTAVDQKVSDRISEINFIGVRYKDDYHFLCNSHHDADKIIKNLQLSLKEYNLALSEKKSAIFTLPEGLFRQWKVEYKKLPNKLSEKSISYADFEYSLLLILEVDKKHPNTGAIDAFLGKLWDKKEFTVHLEVDSTNIHNVISLLFHLRERRPKSFPHIIGILEAIYKGNAEEVQKIIEDVVKNHINDLMENHQQHTYEIVWLSYFVKSNGLFDINWPDDISSNILRSIKNNRKEIFSDSNYNLFSPIENCSKEVCILQHLSVFKKKKT